MTLSGGHYGPGVDRAQGIRQIRDAHERGVTFFDTITTAQRRLTSVRTNHEQ